MRSTDVAALSRAEPTRLADVRVLVAWGAKRDRCGSGAADRISPKTPAQARLQEVWA